MESSGLSGSAAGAGLTTAEMMDPYMLGLNGFGYDPKWILDAGRDYPRLAWEGTAGQIIPEPIIDWLDGRGTDQEPYRVDIADQLILLSRASALWDKHFILGTDIDLDPNLQGRQVFSQAVIRVFSGVFDGNDHTISHLTISGDSYLGLFGQLGSAATISNLGLEAVDVNGTGVYVGGLVGYNDGHIATCYSTGTVNGTGDDVGGLVGYNDAHIATCYSTGTVSGRWSVGGLVGSNGWNRGSITASYSAGSVSGDGWGGGLVGDNWGSIASSYSSGAVSGTSSVGGLVGCNWGSIASSFWDMETSGLLGSDGGVGLTTAEMMDPEIIGLNGLANDPNWILDPGRDYPRLAWEGAAGELIPLPLIDWMDGDGTAEMPYQITDVDQLIRLSKASALADKYLILINDLDLAGLSWFQALIPRFSGSFDGNGFCIRNVSIQGGRHLGLIGILQAGVVTNLGLENISVEGTGYYVGGLVGSNDDGSIATSYSTGTVSGSGYVGGLVGYNWGSIASSYSTGTVSGTRGYVGGLVGYNGGSIASSYSTGTVSGDEDVGGLVGRNGGSITSSYSSGAVSGTSDVGGLLGSGSHRGVTACFWDIETSGQTTSAAGTGRTTSEMQTAGTFLEAGWDFVDETANGTNDIWWILEGRDYPRLWWQFWAFCPNPQDGATDVALPLILRWKPGRSVLYHDVYLGEDKQAVADATMETADIYRGRQSAEMTTYDPGILELAKTYYWRVDEVTEADPNNPWKGHIWSFTVADFIVVDDFESYNDISICLTWIDSFAGPIPELRTSIRLARGNVHGGAQAMAYQYDNNFKSSQATRAFTSLRDWTQGGVTRLSLWFYGDPANAPERMNVGLNGTTPAYHTDPSAATISAWTEWIIDLSEFGVPLTDVTSMTIGFGVPGSTAAGGKGDVIFDDIRLYLPAPEPEP
jgi:hypothetical protein